MSLIVENLEAFNGAFRIKVPRLEVPAGEIVCLMGPSGSGKTTLLSAIGGFIPASGTISIGGQRVDGLPAEKRKIASMFQRPALFNHISVVENVEFGLRVQGIEKRERRVRAMQWLERVGLGGMENRRAWEISEGQAQRVAFARSLIVGFPVLLLDEPFSALDEKTRKDLAELLKKCVVSEKISALFVTHQSGDVSLLGGKHLNLGDVLRT